LRLIFLINLIKNNYGYFNKCTNPPYNAVANGINDDTAALQAAINASIASPLNKKTVQFPHGTYLITSSIILPSGVIIEGNNSTIIRKSDPLNVFDIITNSDHVNGNDDIFIKDLRIDGNCWVDNLDPANSADRFAGLYFEKVFDSRLDNITVNNTINGEIQAVRTRGAYYFHNCIDIKCNSLNGYFNDRTCILLHQSSRIRILGSETANNKGSGMSSQTISDCEFHFLESYNNGYSNISINGSRCRISNVYTHHSDLSGLNIAHVDDPSDFNFVSMVHSHSNKLDGVTVSSSTGVSIIQLNSYNNAKSNLRFKDLANRSRSSHVFVENASENGIKYESGVGHVIDNVISSMNNFSGILALNQAELTIGLGAETYNNSQSGQGVSGVNLNKVNNCRVFGLNSYDNQINKTQIGLYIEGDSFQSRENQILFDWSIKNNKNGINIKEVNVVNLQQDNQFLHDGVSRLLAAVLPGWTAYMPVGFYLDVDGFVHLFGAVENGTSGTVVFNLPSGYRPVSDSEYTVANPISIVRILTNGDIIVSSGLATRFYFDGIIFKSARV